MTVTCAMCGVGPLDMEYTESVQVQQIPAARRERLTFEERSDPDEEVRICETCSEIIAEAERKADRRGLLTPSWVGLGGAALFGLLGLAWHPLWSWQESCWGSG